MDSFDNFAEFRSLVVVVRFIRYSLKGSLSFSIIDGQQNVGVKTTVLTEWLERVCRVKLGDIWVTCPHSYKPVVISCSQVNCLVVGFLFGGHVCGHLDSFLPFLSLRL